MEIFCSCAHTGFLLPQWKLADCFDRFAELLFHRYGDRVKYWITFNEMNMVITDNEKTSMAACYGAKKPEGRNATEFNYQIFHNMMLAHAKAVRSYRSICGKKGHIGVMIGYTPFYPLSTRPEDVQAALISNRLLSEFCLDLCVFGKYPEYLKRFFEQQNLHIDITPEDEKLVASVAVDFTSFSYYQSRVARAVQPGEATPGIGSQFRIIDNPFLRANDWNWAVDPVGIRLVIERLHEHYRLPVFVLENGLALHEKLDSDNTVEDDDRIEYVREHIRQCRLAVEDGAELLGYLYWGPIDILSSHGEMEKRYGFIYVNRSENDIKDLKRYKKKSFSWFRDVIRSNGEKL